MENRRLAIASVPLQGWSGQLYEYPRALSVGTIFPELNMPFFAADDLPEIDFQDDAANSSLNEREKLMARIQAVSFALDDLVLFLDTHPIQHEAAELKEKLQGERRKLLEEYDEKYYPLTRDCKGTWAGGPLPWEGACV